MTETARHDGDSDTIQSDFVARIYTPKPAMEVGIRLHLCGLPPSNTVSISDTFGVDRCRSTVHNWLQEADIEPRGGRESAKIGLDEPVVEVDGVQYSFFAAVEPDVNVFLHAGLNPTRTTMAQHGCRLDCSDSGCIFGRDTRR